MNRERAVLVERIALLAGFIAIVAAVGAFDWRLGLAFAGLVLCGSAVDIPRRRP